MKEMKKIRYIIQFGCGCGLADKVKKIQTN